MTGKNNGLLRHPIEYLLYGVIVLLAVILLWSVWVIRQDNRLSDGESDKTEQSSELVGSVEEINQLTDEELEAERSTDENFDKQEESGSSADASAENIGGIYDEASY